MSLKRRHQVLTPAKLPWFWLGFIYKREFKTTDQEVKVDPSINLLGLWRNKSGIYFGCQGDVFTLSYYAEMELDTDCTVWRMKNALKHLQHRAIETDTVPVQSPGIKLQPSPTSELQIFFKRPTCSLSLTRGIRTFADCPLVTRNTF